MANDHPFLYYLSCIRFKNPVCQWAPVFSLVVVCLMHSPVSNAQDFHYSPFEKNVYANEVQYIIGKENDDVIIWLYKWKSGALQVLVYNSEMKPVSKKILVLHDVDQLKHFSFLKKTSGRDIVIQYFSKGKAITKLYSFDRTRNKILPGQTLEESDVYTQLTIKQSPDNNYTGFLKGYITKEDSLLVQYSLADVTDHPIYQTSFVLPYQNRSFNLEDALIDNLGNLFFYTQTANNKKDTQTIDIYEINREKDSLFTNQISRQGAFSAIHTRQSDLTGLPCISGVLTEPLVSLNSAHREARYFFLQQLSEGLTQENGMVLVPFPSALNSSYFPLSGLEVTNFVESKDSSYLFYMGGLLNGRYMGNLFNETKQLSSGNPNKFTALQTVNIPLSSPLLIPSTPPDTKHKPLAADNVSISRKAASGENFFSTAIVAPDKHLATQMFTDTSQNNTLPEFDIVINTGKNIQYLYSRLLTNKKQLIYDVVASKDGSMRMNPLLPLLSFHILISGGTQISPGSIIFPYLNYQKLSFVRLNLK